MTSIYETVFEQEIEIEVPPELDDYINRYYGKRAYVDGILVIRLSAERFPPSKRISFSYYPELGPIIREPKLLNQFFVKLEKKYHGDVINDLLRRFTPSLDNLDEFESLVLFHTFKIIGKKPDLRERFEREYDEFSLDFVGEYWDELSDNFPLPSELDDNLYDLKGYKGVEKILDDLDAAVTYYDKRVR